MTPDSERSSNNNNNNHQNNRDNNQSISRIESVKDDENEN
jgi:hypothetical protein